MVSQTTKGYLSVIGAFCIQFISGSIYTWASINSYVASYLVIKGNIIEIKDVYFLLPSVFFVKYCIFTIGVKLAEATSVRLTNILGISLMLGGYSSLIFARTLPQFLLGLIGFGIGDGICNLSTITNAWKYFPQSKGTISGIVLAGLGLSASILNPLADLIINPNLIDADIYGFYPFEVATRLTIFLYVIVVLFGILGLIGIVCSIPYSMDIQVAPSLNEDSDKMVPLLSHKSSIYEDNNNMWEGFFSVQNAELAFFCFCGPFFFFIITNTNRTFGNLCNLSQGVLQWLAFLYGLTNGMCRFLWGWLLDKFNFKKLMTVILIIELTVACSIYYIAYNPLLYLIENLLIALCVGGTFVMLIPCFTHIFGLGNGPKIYGLTGILVGFSCMVGPIVSEFIVKSKIDYLKLYLIGGGCVFINLIVCFIFEEKPFLYKSTIIDKLDE